ncbi:MAG: S9 family peptidase [Bryobacteraceae bacterium]|nr:S9 family peptidase [Bryobacteraceae bacterium]
MRVRFPLVALAVCLCGTAEELPLEKLFARPYIWGTAPRNVSWSKQGHTLVFLWNAKGNRFLDLYAYRPDGKKLERLTNLESFADDLLLSEAERDDRRKLYLEPREGIAEFDVSRDGAVVAFSYCGELFIVDVGGAAPPLRLTRTKDVERSPQLSPDATKVAFIRAGQAYVQNLANGQLWQVTAIEGEDELIACRWSPDAARFACIARKGKQRQMPLPNYSGRVVTARLFTRTLAGDEPPPHEVFLIPSEGGKPVPVDLGEWEGKGYLSAPEWADDSSAFALRLVHPSMKDERLLAVNASNGKAALVWEEHDPRWVYWSEFGWSPDSKQLFFLSEKDGWAHIYRAPTEGGEAVQVTRGAWEARPERFSFGEGFAPQWAGDYIYYASTEEGTSERHFYRIRPDGSGKEKLSRREGINLGLVSEDGARTAWLIAGLNTPVELWVGEDRVTRRPDEFEAYPWPETKFLHFPSRGDGKTVAAKMLLPPGYPAGKKWPAVFFIHGAGIATSVLKQWGSYHDLRYAYNSYLANRGYVIMDLDYRGSSGYGRDWRSEVYLHMGGLDLQDVLGGVDYLAGLGNIDMRRVGIWGVSYGGFMTNMAMFLAPDEFQAGSSWASVNDWENYNAGYTRQRLNTPRENPEAYRRSSPITFSGMLKNRLLIVHGMIDDNVLFQDAVQLSQKLIQEGKEFGQIYYPEESHGFVRDETWIDACRRTTEWFDRHLK